ncbi:hypothetical protein [Parabacteroides sp.]
MDILAKQVNDYLKNEYELNIQYDEEKGEFYFSIDMDHVCLDVRIICREEDKLVLLLAYVPIKIPKSQYTSVLRLVNKIQMNNLDSVNLFINEECNQLMSLSVLNVGSDFRIDKEVFGYAFCPLLNILDDHFVELLRILSNEEGTQNGSDEISTLTSLSEQNDPEAQYRLAIKYYKGEGVEQDLGKAIELFGASLSNGRNGTAHTLKECIDDLSCRIKEFSETQDYEKASSLRALIDKSENLLNLYGKE